MFETGVRQMRVAFATVFGRPIPVRALQRLLADALATLEEFGSPGDDVQHLLDGPYADPGLRVQLQVKALRRTARRMTARSSFYRDRFAASDVDPARLTLDTMRAVPVTARWELDAHGPAMRCGRPFLSTRTSGTTAAPLEVWLSRYEMELWPALVALSMVLRGELGPNDHVQISTNVRATATMQADVELCRLVGAACSVVGLVDPEEGLDRLRGRFGLAPTVLNTYPSYLGALVTAARDRGLGPDDFALHTVNVGGEMMTVALADAARQTLGASRIDDSYGATELMPFGGRSCEQGHLHLDPNLGYAEVLDLSTMEPVEPGELGTLVVTPYFPYRECTPVFRYDTRDLVRLPVAQRTTCELAAIPAVSQILGKANDLVHTADGPVTPRQIAEVLEAIPGVRWPVRFTAHATGGRLRITVPRSCLPPEVNRPGLAETCAARGIDAEVVVAVGDPPGGRPLRADFVLPRLGRQPSVAVS
ncbi:MAG TPA: AMP-binding protein [Mycobacterium sp.]|nr:AMP-binding protein [Mycobacterium sp.]